jgi:type III secretion protein V
MKTGGEAAEGARRGERRSIGRYSDLVLALLVSGVVGMMILPLPTQLLDVLLALNLALAVTLLLVAIYVSDALRIATFPTILLVTTLYRLGLNVSSTRLILLQADAGRVIEAFGEFVVRGNYVVGAVVFLVLTIIQFVVIAKGSERVAEVAARFTLDALPGKQMAIDADLRAGLMDQAEARVRRRALQRESQFYGAMDGAMKFVKGDAIAGIVIILVNIGAGLAIGVLQRGMEVEQALRVYGLLTIGDGLVCQIPALVISTAAGLVITRVASEEEGAHLGEEIGAQVLAHPRALAVTAGLLTLLAFVPGLPTVPFLMLGVLCALGAFGLNRARVRASKRAAADDLGEPAAEDAEPGERAQAGPSPVTLEVGPALAGLVDAKRAGAALGPAVSRVRQRLARDLGVRVPPVRVRVVSEGLDDGEVAILLDDVPAARAAMRADAVLCHAAADELRSLGIDARPAEHPLSEPACWVPETAADQARAAGFAVSTGTEVLASHLEQVLRRNAACFVGLQDVQALIDGLESTHPALVRAVIPRVVGIPLMADVLRRLIDEGVSIRNLRAVLEALLEWGEHEKDPVALTELVRSSLKRQITYRYTRGEPGLSVYLLSPDIEAAVRSAVQRSSTGTYLALEPGLAREIVAAVKGRVARPAGGDAVILTQPDVRRFVRKLIELEVPHAAVVSYQELEPHVVVRPLARIGL